MLLIDTGLPRLTAPTVPVTNTVSGRYTFSYVLTVLLIDTVCAGHQHRVFICGDVIWALPPHVWLRCHRTVAVIKRHIREGEDVGVTNLAGEPSGLNEDNESTILKLPKRLLCPVSADIQAAHGLPNRHVNTVLSTSE